MDRRRKGESGFSLIELLVVLAIIGVIGAVSIPLLARAGLFTSSKADLAARELFNVLRTAKIYATTHNVETAVAYGGLLVQDSFSGETVPVVDSVALVRRLKRDELLRHGLGANDAIFVLLSARAGEFKTFPSGTCILPDIFEYDPGLKVSITGLGSIEIRDVENNLPIEPRLDYNLGDPNDLIGNIFPAHSFSPEGALLANVPQQRLKLRVGLLPSADIGDRAYIDFNDPDPEKQLDVDDEETITVVFTNADPTDLDTVTIYHDPTRPVHQEIGTQVFDTPIDIDVEILLYVATGRVKVAS